MGIFSKTTDYFGIDIGATSVRLVQLKKHGNKPVLVAYGTAPLPANLVASDSVDAVDQLALAIKKLVKEAGITTKSVVAALPAAKVFASVITTPKLSAAELGKAVRYQADQYIPMPIDQVRLDWTVLGPGANENEQLVLLIAAPNTTTEKYLQIFEKAGLELVALEVDVTALSRAVLTPDASHVVMLDVGSLASTVSLVVNGSPRLIHSVPAGAAAFVQALGQGLKIDPTQAMAMVQKFGMNRTSMDGKVLKSLQPIADSILDEIKKSVAFYTNENPDAKFDKLVFTGGAAGMPELPLYIANSLKMPVELGNAWLNVSYPSNMQSDLAAVNREYAVAVGCASRMVM